jgi:apolipoprotein N-acyltransferase
MLRPDDHRTTPTMKVLFGKLKIFSPDRVHVLCAFASAVLGALAFPDFGIDFLILVALVPLLLALALRPVGRASAFTSGWVFGFLFFFSTTWWLTHALIQYAEMNPIISFLLIATVALVAGLFPALFSMLMAGIVGRMGALALLTAPFVWLLSDLLRYHLTGNNWNSLGYALAFSDLVGLASLGGIGALTFLPVLFSTGVVLLILHLKGKIDFPKSRMHVVLGTIWIFAIGLIVLGVSVLPDEPELGEEKLRVISIQPNVPMSGLSEVQERQLLGRHFNLVAQELQKTDGPEDVLVVFPESPMPFSYGTDEALRALFNRFSLTNGISLMFNSMEWASDGIGLTNSALVVGPTGRLTARYDKYHLLPFGEFSPMPAFVDEIFPTVVGSFVHGDSVEPIEVGRLRAGVMICFETHFGSLSRNYSLKGADFMIELTNDGYLGKTPVLRQHLANSVVRSVETGLPLVRSTNVGITALVLPDGRVVDEAPVYTEASRQWVMSSADRPVTLYTRIGDGFFWFGAFMGLALSFLGLRKGRTPVQNSPK